MFNRIHELRVPLRSLFAEIDSVEEYSSEEWKMISAYVNVFKSLKEATKLMEGDKYISSSLYLPVIYGLDVSLQPPENATEMEVALYEEVREAVKARFSFAIVCDALVCAMILDPRFKDRFLDDDILATKTAKVISFMEKYCKDTQEEEIGENNENNNSRQKRRRVDGNK